MTDKIPSDAALRSRVADLLHLLQFARIETPTAGDAGQAEKAMNDLERMLAQQPAPAVPMGWKLVPVESSIEMEDAGRKAASRLMGLSEANRVYRAMLAAAPAAPAGWKLVPIEPTPEMLAATSWPGCAGADYAKMIAAAPAAPVAVGQEPMTCCPYCGGSSGRCDPSFPHPPAAEQPDTVAVPRELLGEAESIIESYAEALKASHAPGGDWEGEEDVWDDYEREAGVAAKLRALLAGGEA